LTGSASVGSEAAITSASALKPSAVVTTLASSSGNAGDSATTFSKRAVALRTSASASTSCSAAGTSLKNSTRARK